MLLYNYRALTFVSVLSCIVTQRPTVRDVVKDRFITFLIDIRLSSCSSDRYKKTKVNFFTISMMKIESLS